MFTSQYPSNQNALSYLLWPLSGPAGCYQAAISSQTICRKVFIQRLCSQEHMHEGADVLNKSSRVPRLFVSTNVPMPFTGVCVVCWLAVEEGWTAQVLQSDKE